MRYLLLLIVLFIASLACAQSGVVIEITKPEAEKAKALFEAKLKAEKDWEVFRKSIDKVYGPELEFSADFKFLVQRPPSFTYNCGSNSLCSWNGSTITVPNYDSGMIVPNCPITYK